MTDRVSVPTSEIERWVAVGWSVVCPDFDRPNHTHMRWTGLGEPRSPHGEVR